MALAKITRPRLGRLLPRPRLFRLLDGHRPLAWVWGPPGAGKTALVASWTETRRARTLWYQCDAGDVSVAAFLDYLARAAGRTRRGAPTAEPAAEAVRDWLRALFERLRAPFVVVLDDYQEIPADSPVHEAVRVVVDELPPGARVLVTSRAQPPPLLARLRAAALQRGHRRGRLDGPPADRSRITRTGAPAGAGVPRAAAGHAARARGRLGGRPRVDAAGAPRARRRAPARARRHR